MQTVGRIIQQLSAQGFQLCPVRLTLCQYLSHLYSPEDLFSHEVLISFLQDCMEYPHWLQHRSDLVRDLENVLRDLGESEIVEPGEIHDFLDRQVIEITHDRDFSEAVQAYLTHRLKGESKPFRLFRDGNRKMVAICQRPDGGIEVRQFDRKFLIRHGQLTPVREDLILHFSPDLELDHQKIQKMEVAPYVIARFKSDGYAIQGKLVRGYIFQKLQEMNQVELESVPRLFLAIKRLEQFFIRRESDPYYQRLTQELERTIQLIRLGEPLSPASLTELQLSVQNALEYVFNGDKLLSLLLKDLQHSMGQLREVRDRNLKDLMMPQSLAGQSLAGQSSEQEIWQTQAPKVYKNPYLSLKPARVVESASTSSSLKKDIPLGVRPTVLSKRVESPSTARGSTSLESELMPSPIESSLMGSH